MNKKFNIPPKNPQDVLTSTELVKCLSNLIGEKIQITGKPRTDGANARKMVEVCLQKYSFCEVANKTDYTIIPPKRKGIPRIIGELIDTYLVTSGNNYNLQIWNRFPNSKSTLIEYYNGKKIRACDIRLVFLKVNLQRNIIESIIILSPSYIERKFGPFGKPTIKHQIIISEKNREKIYNKILLGTDTPNVLKICRKTYSLPNEGMSSFPIKSKPFCIQLLSKLVEEKLIGTKLQSADTKNRGQILERKVMKLLGYNSQLVGSYPDIPNQILEVKVQDSATIDLGKYTPEFEEFIFSNITTKDVRYLIALTNSKTYIIEGIVLVSGKELGETFSFVSDTSFKCQRSMPMTYFEKYIDKCVFNP